MEIPRAWRVAQSEFSVWLPAMREAILHRTHLWILQNMLGENPASFDHTDGQRTRRVWTTLMWAAQAPNHTDNDTVSSLNMWYHKAHFYVRGVGIPEVIRAVHNAGAEEYGVPATPPSDTLAFQEWERKQRLWSGFSEKDMLTHSVFDPRRNSESEFRWWASELKR
jgi:hypothetical protein